MTSRIVDSRLAEAKGMEEGRANRWIPDELSFEEIIKNNTLPPCSLNDYMDYLVHVEQNAENLQFFLWFCDYIQRWVKLCPKQRALSKPWKHTGVDMTGPSVTTTITSTDDTSEKRQQRQQGHTRSTSQKLETILQILEEESEKERERKQSMDTISEAPFSPVTSERRNHSRRPSVPNLSRPKTPGSQPMMEECPYGNVITFTIQPFQDEISRVVRHYIAPLSTSTPRPLFLLTPEARAEVHRAAQQTTHPSAILPALEVAETVVRASHPNFIRWAVRNANAPRLYFWRIIGALMILLGMLLVVLFSMLPVAGSTTIATSGHGGGDGSPGTLWLWVVRAVAASLFWWPGMLLTVAAFRGVCVVRFVRGTRDVRPWELGEELPFTGKSVDDDNEENGASEVLDLEAGGRMPSSWRKHHRDHHHGSSGGGGCGRRGTVTSSSVSSLGGMMNVQTGNVNFDPLRKGTMQTFGPANDHMRDMGCWNAMGAWSRIWAPEVPVPEDCRTRKLQRRVVVMAGVWAVVATAALVLGSAFLPRLK